MGRDFKDFEYRTSIAEELLKKKKRPKLFLVLSILTYLVILSRFLIAFLQ